MLSRLGIVVLIGGIGGLFFACANEDLLKTGSLEQLGSIAKSHDGVAANQDRPNPVPVFRGKYQFILQEKKEYENDRIIVLCQAIFYGNLLSNSAFVPEGTMKCLDGSERSLSEALASMPSQRIKDLPGYGRIVRTQSPDSSALSYNPPPPAGLNVVQNHEEYRDFVFEEDGEVRVVTENETLKDYGTHRIRVLGINQVFKAAKGQTFDSVVEYETTNTGFNSIPRHLSKIYPKKKYLVNSWPPALIQVKINAMFSDFSPDFLGPLGDRFLGEMELLIQLIEALPF